MHLEHQYPYNLWRLAIHLLKYLLVFLISGSREISKSEACFIFVFLSRIPGHFSFGFHFEISGLDYWSLLILRSSSFKLYVNIKKQRKKLTILYEFDFQNRSSDLCLCEEDTIGEAIINTKYMLLFRILHFLVLKYLLIFAFVFPRVSFQLYELYFMQLYWGTCLLLNQIMT